MHVHKMTGQKVRRAVRGVTLIELMVALAIGSFLMIGAVTVFMQSRTAFRVTESISRLQENARFVLDALEPDIRMTSYFGLTTRSNKVQGRATPLQPVPAGLGVGNDCGQNWTINLVTEIGGANNNYNWACLPSGGVAQPQADTLVIRRTTEDPIPVLQPNTMYVQSARFRDSQLFVGAVPPAGFLAATSAPHQLIVNGYYVSPTSSLSTPGNLVPSLRMKTLAVGPQVIDQEVLPGVEDMQVQFGLDTDLPGTPNRGSIDRYVNPGAPIITPGNVAFDPNAQILAVRIWLRLRSERPEQGYTDTANYIYADQNVPPFNDQFRRTIVSKTIYLRNARSAA